ESGSGDTDDTYLVVLLGTMLHDIGNQVHRTGHEAHGVALAIPLLERVLGQVYPNEIEKRTKLRSFILHSINCHDLAPAPLTLEGGITAVADGTDITKGRGRKAFALGKIDIHSVSALSIEQVTIARGQDKPIEIRVRMTNSAGIFQIEETLAKKVINTPLRQYVDIIASALENTSFDERIIETVHLEGKGFVKPESRK
ncbi:MAG: phosphohydrolase, partial [Deinococcales bacterium]